MTATSHELKEYIEFFGKFGNKNADLSLLSTAGNLEENDFIQLGKELDIPTAEVLLLGELKKCFSGHNVNKIIFNTFLEDPKKVFGEGYDLLRNWFKILDQYSVDDANTSIDLVVKQPSDDYRTVMSNIGSSFRSVVETSLLKNNVIILPNKIQDCLEMAIESEILRKDFPDHQVSNLFSFYAQKVSLETIAGQQTGFEPFFLPKFVIPGTETPLSIKDIRQFNPKKIKH